MISRIGILLALATAVRLAILPLATTDGSDSVSRVWAAWRWLSDPHWITHGVWGPLHSYLIAAVLAVFSDPVLPPVLLHVILGVAAVVLMYRFTRIEFGDPRAAFIVALSFAVYPIAVRNSVSVRSETPYALCLLAAMVHIARIRGGGAGRTNAVAAGFLMTLACMLRYEAWLLIPLLAVMLWKTWRLALLFAVVAMIHPLLWMAGNAVEFGDPLYSMNWAAHWELQQMGRSAVGLGQHLRDALSFMTLTFRGLTFVVASACIAGAAISLVRRTQATLWLLPLCGVAAAILAAIARGSLVPKHNYTITLGVLLLPFSAVCYRRLAVDTVGIRRYALSCGLIVASVLACSSDRVRAWTGLPSIVGISSVPRIRNQATALRLPDVVLAQLNGEDAGLISDFYGWGQTHYVALLTRLHPDRVYVAAGAPNQSVDLDRLTEFLGRCPEGVMILQAGSRFSAAIAFDAAGGARVGERTLRLTAVQSVDWPGGAAEPAAGRLDVFRYVVGGWSSP